MSEHDDSLGNHATDRRVASSVPDTPIAALRIRSAAQIERQITLHVGAWIGLYMQPDNGESEYVDAQAERLRCQIQALVWANSPELSWSAAGEAATDMIEEAQQEAES